MHFKERGRQGTPSNRTTVSMPGSRSGLPGSIEMPEVSKRYRSLLSERSAVRRAVAAAPNAENIQDPGRPEAEQPFDLETEIKLMMDEDERTPKV